MESSPKEVLIYVSSAGKSPFEDWLVHLKDIQGRAKVRTRLRRLEAGNYGQHRQLGQGIFELKIDFGPGYRVYCGEDGPRLVLLLCGGDKGSQHADVLKARNLWADYLGRRQSHGKA